MPKDRHHNDEEKFESELFPSKVFLLMMTTMMMMMVMVMVLLMMMMPARI